MRKNSRAYSFFNGRFFWRHFKQGELNIGRDKAVNIRATCAKRICVTHAVFAVRCRSGCFHLNRTNPIVGQPDPKIVLLDINVMHGDPEIIFQNICSKKFTGAADPYSGIVVNQASSRTAQAFLCCAVSSRAQMF